ncbi:hypothetical protein LDENG_00134720 [Lucifuga dentata]|nr:hypothetical protein LDENG_00134720 [Lucifuga dentata]
MESFSAETEENTEDVSGQKKSKLKSLKSRLFGRSKRSGEDRKNKLSQSSSDVTAGKELGSDEDLACPQGMMGSRALSHDSIFLADQVVSDAKPDRVLSHENVHSKIKALQMKLQLQQMHLGPPPLVLPIRRPEDPSSHSEDDSLTHSPPEISGGNITTQGALSKAIPQSSRPLSPVSKPTPTKSVSSTTSGSFILSTSPSYVAEPPLDLSSPPQFTPCLDTSAARHRMAVKPRNQRASTKGKRYAATDPCLHTLNNINHPVSEEEKEQKLTVQEEITHFDSTQILETGQGEANVTITSQCLPLKSPESAPTTSEPKAAPKSSSPTFPHQDHPPPPGRAPSVSAQVLEVKSNRPVISSEQTPSNLKEERESPCDLDLKITPETGSLNKSRMDYIKSKEVSVPFSQVHTKLGTVISFRSSSLRQQVQGQTEATGIKRPAPGSGSFHFNTAKAQDGERPRSSSFLGVLEHTGGKVKTGGGVEDISLPSSMDQREKKVWIEEGIKLRDVKPRGTPTAVGGLKEHGGLHKSSVLPWDRSDSLKRGDSATSKSVTTNTGALEGMEVVESQEVKKEAETEEVQEEEGKTTFGIKLRSTTLSKKMRSETDAAYSDFKIKNHRADIDILTPPTVPYNFPSKSVVAEEQSDKRKRQEIGTNASYISNELPTNISCIPITSGELRETDGPPTSSDFSHPVKHNPLPASDSHTVPTAVQTISSNPKAEETVLTAPQEPQPTSQTASSEASWMSLAMEKTRSLQQLLTSRFPRDFTTATRSQTQTQPENQEQTLSHSQKLTAIQQSSDAATPPTMQSGSQTQTAKASLIPTTVQEKPSVLSINQSHTSREPKQTNDPSLNTNISQSDTQSSVYSSPQGGNTTQFTQGSTAQSVAQQYLSLGQHAKPQQASWSNRSFHFPNQLKSTTSVSNTASTPAPPIISALAKGERAATIQRKEGPSLSERRAVFGGSVGEKATLEKQAELATPPGTKAESRKTQTETRASAESPSLANTTPLIKDTKQEGGQGVKLAESSPIEVPDRPVNCEDKWLRKNVMSPSSPSSSPMLQSPLQSMSDSGQPSWMELAKRKSMAWSDKNMD